MTVIRSFAESETQEITSYRIEDEDLHTLLDGFCDDSRREYGFMHIDEEHPMEYTHGNVTISIYPVAGWEYEVVEYTDDASPFGFRARPKKFDEGWIYFTYRPDFVPGVEYQTYPPTTQTPGRVYYFTEDAPEVQHGMRLWNYCVHDNGLMMINEGCDSWFEEYESEIGIHIDFHPNPIVIK